MKKTKPGTALVTGASSGVGVAFARELARRKYDLVITARRTDLLADVRRELQDEFGTRVEVIQCDLAADTGAQQLFDDVAARGLSVDLLVNNAGLGRFGSLLDQSEDELDTMIQVNLRSLTMLTRLFAVDMQQRGSGFILNHSSFSAIQPPPYYAVYAATKSYVQAFSLAVDHDLRRTGVRVSALCSGFIDSDFYETAGQEPNRMVKLIMLRREHIARAGVAGVLKGKTVIIPGVFYKVTNLLMRLVPRRTAVALADFVVGH